eukprot:42822_1
MTTVFLSNGARAVPKTKQSAAFVSTNAAIDLHLRTGTIGKFRNSFWNAVVARSSKRGGSKTSKAVENDNSLPKKLNERKHQSQEENEVAMLRKCAREDAFKHVRLSAASRAMKRGDGVMSKYYSLNGDAPSNHHYKDSMTLRTELPSLIDVATAKEAREEMHRHFWSSHQSRRDTQEEIEVRLSNSSRLHTITSTHNLHEDRFKLPDTLRDAYLEFGSQMAEVNHRPRPMAITETKPPFQIVDVNKAWTQLCGYTREEAIGSTLRELLQGPDSNPEIAKNLASTLMHAVEVDAEHEAVLCKSRSNLK